MTCGGEWRWPCRGDGEWGGGVGGVVGSRWGVGVGGMGVAGV